MNKDEGNLADGGEPSEDKQVVLDPDEEKEMMKLLTDDLFSSDVKTVAGSLDALGDFCISFDGARDAVNRQYILDVDGVGSIYRVLKKNLDDVYVLSAGSRAMGSIMQSNEEVCCKIRRLEAVPTVIEAMKAHTELEEMQINGCLFLGNFVWENKERQKLVVELGGIETILSAMKNHPNAKILQQNAATAIYTLIKTEEYLVTAYKGGVFELLAGALHKEFLDPQAHTFAKKSVIKLNQYLQSSEV